jgi:hypothetical protein
MRIFLFTAGLFFTACAIFVATTIRSDIQTGIFATCLVGAVLSYGQASILSGQAAIRRKLDERS